MKTTSIYGLVALGVLSGGCTGALAKSDEPTRPMQASGDPVAEPPLSSLEEIGAAPARFIAPEPVAAATVDPLHDPPEPMSPNGVDGKRPARPIPGLGVTP